MPAIIPSHIIFRKREGNFSLSFFVFSGLLSPPCRYLFRELRQQDRDKRKSASDSKQKESKKKGEKIFQEGCLFPLFSRKNKNSFSAFIFRFREKVRSFPFSELRARIFLRGESKGKKREKGKKEETVKKNEGRRARLERTETAYERMQSEIFGGEKIPHGMSLPVIRRSRDEYRLAAFVFFFTASDVRKGRIGRPTMWIEADIRTGHVVAEHQTRESEFSDAGYKEMLDIRGQGISDRRHQLSLLEMLDPLRRTAAEGRIDSEEYGKYLQKAQAEMPTSYRRFYADLSDVSPVPDSSRRNAEKRLRKRISKENGDAGERKKIVSFYIDRKSHEMLRRMAFEQGKSMSSVLCGILRKVEKEK